jgi:hypothetical protein
VIPTYNEIASFIIKHRNARTFKNWHADCYEHATSIVTALINKHAFISFDDAGHIRGLALGYPLADDNKEFHVTQLLCLNKEARRDIVKQFMDTYPGVIVREAYRRGKLMTYKNSDKLLKHLATN